MNVLDCVIIGAGPSGMSAALMLGRARRNIAVFDDGTNRNRVSHEAHGFITRDGISPQMFKELGIHDLLKYPSVSYIKAKVTDIEKISGEGGLLLVKTKNHDEYLTEKLILATGVQEVIPIPNARQYYGKSLFSCPYCHGWELRDQALIIIAYTEAQAVHMGKLVYQWSKDLVIATNGAAISEKTKAVFQNRNIPMITEPIKNLLGENGILQQVEFKSGKRIARTGGFIVPSYYRSNQFVENLGLEVCQNGLIVTDGSGRTTCKNVYVAGEAEKVAASSLIFAAADGSKAAIAVNTDLMLERF
ncbi:NAD(P)/FAD-dependent oxidoreductase [Niallia sp.]|uniref:NAD(P)/FAD-dependent oxidoreductase n=1 Tax=Niallia sp. TaxID=2837523 RepID=UPI00289A4732|nr:NAD(P)/FAD-dependent oxidoreductase [Niallia sp.]